MLTTFSVIQAITLKMDYNPVKCLFCEARRQTVEPNTKVRQVRACPI